MSPCKNKAKVDIDQSTHHWVILTMQLDRTWASLLAPAVRERQAPGRVVPWGKSTSTPWDRTIFNINHRCLIEIKCHKSKQKKQQRVMWTLKCKKKNMQLNPNNEKGKTEESSFFVFPGVMLRCSSLFTLFVSWCNEVSNCDCSTVCVA